MNILKTAAIIATLAAAPAYANPCEQVGELANSIMTKRQGGVPIAQAMSTIVHDDLEKPIAELFTLIILEAYGQMGYSTEKMQQRSIVEFTNRMTVACYKGLK